MNISNPSAEITGKAALEIVRVGMATAEAMERSIYIAVVSRNLQLLAFCGHETTPFICRQIAQDKAYTAVATGGDTAGWKNYVYSCPPEERDLMLRQPRFIAAAGGVAIIHEGQLIGGVGVSGAGQAEDNECALAGLCALGIKDTGQ